MDPFTMFRRSQKPSNSFDHKLFFTFFVGMFLQMLLPIHGITRIILTILWVSVLVRFAIQHRQRHQWRWCGLTFLNVLKSIGTLVFGTWFFFLFFRDIFDYSFIDQNGALSSQSLQNSIEIINSLARVLLMTKNPIVSFFLIPFVGLIFSVLLSLNLVYSSEEEFLKDCQIQENSAVYHRSQSGNLAARQQLKPLPEKITQFLTSRPFTLQKHSDTVRIEFYRISTQDLQENFAIVSFLLLFFVASLFGFFQMLMLALPDYLNNIEDPEEVPIILVAWGLQVAFFAIFSYLIWAKAIKLFFVKRVIDFKEDELVIGETIFGFYYRLFGICRIELSTLQQKQGQTKIPEVVNAALLMQRRGQDFELAGHLLPEAMETVKTVYNRYRTSEFRSFYHETHSFCIK